MSNAADILHQMANLAFADIDTIAPANSLILAPHADDESLGCGGLIAAACECGRPPLVVSVSDGTASHTGSLSYPPARLKALRADEMREAVAILGLAADQVRFLELPDGDVPGYGARFDQAVQDIVSLIRMSNAGVIFATWPHDPHCDHQATAQIADAAAQQTGARLLFYPVWGWLLSPEQELPMSHVAGVRLDITRYLARKRLAIAAHASQYTDLIADAPNGFRLPRELLAIFDRPFEVFLDP